MVTSKATQDIGRLEGKIDSLKDSVDVLNKKIIGNGQAGLLDRTAVIENCIIERKADADKTDQRLSQIAESLGRLTDSVEKHHADKGQHTIWGQITWKAAAVIIATIAIIVVVVPRDITIWALIAKLFGL